MHKLDKWLTNNSLTRQLFAKKIKISTATLSRYLSGDRIPKQEIMEKIFRATKGSISPDDFYSTKNKSVFVNNFKQQHLLGIEGLNKNEISSLLNRADEIVEESKIKNLNNHIHRGKTLVNLFLKILLEQKHLLNLPLKIRHGCNKYAN